MLVLLFTFVVNGDLQKVTIQPYDIQVESKPETHIKGLWELYQWQDGLIVVPWQEPSALMVSVNEDKITKIGGEGNGPGELGESSPYGTSVTNDSVWILGNGARIANLYVNSSFQTSFKLKDYQLRPITNVTWSFAHNDQFVVIPANPRTKHLARVYDYGGNQVAMIGDILPIDPEMLTYNPFVNSTIWKYQEGKWFCLFVFRPYLRIFNSDFKLEKEILITGEEVDIYEEQFQEREIPEGFNRPRPHFTSLQVSTSSIYVMCHGVLYHLDHQGKLLSRTGFFANDELKKEFGYRPRIHFDYAVVMNNKRVYLGASGHYMDRDLWYADLPN